LPRACARAHARAVVQKSWTGATAGESGFFFLFFFFFSRVGKSESGSVREGRMHFPDVFHDVCPPPKRVALSGASAL
jgi:hypothetical protein